MIYKMELYTFKSPLYIMNSRLFQIVRAHIDKSWDWDALSQNPNTTFDIVLATQHKDWQIKLSETLHTINHTIIQEHENQDNILLHFIDMKYYYKECYQRLEKILENITFPWDWRGLTKNPSITCDTMLANSELPWDRISMSSNPNFTSDILSNIILPLSLDTYSLSWNSNPPFDLVLDNLKAEWNWNLLSEKVPAVIVQTYPHLPWNWEYMSKNPDITWDIVKFFIDKPWDWIDLSNNPGIKMIDIENNMDKNWNWSCISCNPNVTFDFVHKHLDKEWYWFDLSSITDFMPYILTYPTLPWDWGGVSRNYMLTWDIIESHPYKEWDWYEISRNPNITFDIVNAHPDKPWDWDELSMNPNLSLSVIDTNLDKNWNWQNMSYNKFERHPWLQRKLYISSIHPFYTKDWNNLLLTYALSIC